MTLRQWQQTPKPLDDLIVQASFTDGSDSWQVFPIGMSYCYKTRVGAEHIQIGPHSELVLSAISETDRARRPTGFNRGTVIRHLGKNGIQNTWLESGTYFDVLPKYKFVISPEGNGIDCHRHYEALLAGAIPIMEHNNLIQEKYTGCPVLYTYDYSEITPAYLESVYESIIDTHYNFSKLFLSSYSDKDQAEIKKCGNHWMKQITGHAWYT